MAQTRKREREMGFLHFLHTIWAALGPGTVGAAIAGAIYKGAAAVEKDASLVAKQDIAKFLRSFGHEIDISLVARHISDIFEIIFGERHLSAKCLFRSILLTVLFCSIILLI